MLVVFTYLITRDIVETIEQRIGKKLGIDAKSEIENLEENFLKEFWQYIPDNIEKKNLRAKDLIAELSNFENKYPVVSLDRIYFPSAEAYLDVTRITDPITGIMKLGPRPGTEAINIQIESLQCYNRIILADVGAFEGDTLLEINSMIETSGINIEEIIVACTGRNAREKIEKQKPFTSLYTFAFYEWIELRDFFGIDGRKITGNTVKYIPYWENLAKWASITDDNIGKIEELCKYSYDNVMKILYNENVDIEKIGKIVSRRKIK